MHEQESLYQIDLAIESFKRKEGIQDIKVSQKPHSDWLDFTWRQLKWTDKGINYLIEICPSFDGEQNISGWNLYAAASYDLNKNRYYLKKCFAENKSIEYIAKNIEIFLTESYRYLQNVNQKDIPFSVELD